MLLLQVEIRKWPFDMTMLQCVIVVAILSLKEILYNKEKGMPSNLTRKVYEDRHKNIWIGTRNGGIVQFKEGRYLQNIYDRDKGLGSNFIMSIEEDQKGNLIIGTNNNGLSILKKNGDIQNGSTD